MVIFFPFFPHEKIEIVTLEKLNLGVNVFEYLSHLGIISSE